MTDPRPATTATDEATGATGPEPSAEVEVVRGEMQPWTDVAIGGPALVTWLAERSAATGSVLVVGPHGRPIFDVILGGAREVTALRRSPTDAAELAAQLPVHVRVVAGSLDGLVATEKRRYDLVLAADGLDRVLSTDSPALTWAERLGLLSGLVAPGGGLILGVPNDLCLLDLLDERPAKERYDDEEWWPLHADPSRPSDPGTVARQLADAGLAHAKSWTRFGEGSPQALVATEELPSAGGDHPFTDLLVRVARGTARPLLADPEEALRKAARAGLLGALADGWLLHTSSSELGSATAAGYVALDDSTAAVLTRDGNRLVAAVSTVQIHGPLADEAMAAAPPATVTLDSSLLPATVFETARLTATLLSRAEAEDVPAFRAWAAAAGAWFTAETSGRAVTFDDLRVDGDDVVVGLTTLRWGATVTPAEALAAAWFDFQDQLTLEHRRHPWPPWVVGDGLVAIWLAMSGHEVPEDSRPALLRRGRALADDLQESRAGRRLAVRDVRSTLADAERIVHELFEAKGHIAGLERTLGFRDRQLATREERIRSLRQQTAKIERLKQTPAFKMADQTRSVLKRRDPKRVAASAKRVAHRVARKLIKR